MVEPRLALGDASEPNLDARASVLIDGDLRVRSFTAPCLALFEGLERSIGTSLAELRRNFNDDEFLQDIGAVAHRRIMRERIVEADDGRHYLRRVSPSRAPTIGRAGVLVTFSDDPEVLRLAKRLARRDIQQEVLLTFAGKALVAESLKSMLDEAVAAMAQGLAVNVLEVVEWLSGGELARRAGVGPTEDEHHAVLRGVRSMSGDVLAGEEDEVLSHDLLGETRFQDPKLTTRQGARSALSVKIYASGEVYGAVTAAACSLDRFGADDCSFLRSVAKLIGQAVTRFQMAGQVTDENRRALALTVARLGTWEIDPLTGRAWWDARRHEMLGVRPGNDSHSLDDFFSLVHADDRGWVQAVIDEAVRERRAYELDFRIVRPDGRVRWLRDMARPLDGGEGVLGPYIGATADITDQREYEIRLQDARAEAEAAMQSRGEFLANVSHEIRTPMTAILGYADVLKESVQRAESQSCVETIRRNGRFLLDILDDILDLSKIDAGKLEIEHEVVPIQHLLDDIASLMDLRAREKGLSLELTFKGDVPESVRTDGKRLRQVLLNLIGNAVKFTEVGVVRVQVQYARTDGRLWVEVSDTGAGIRSDRLEMLFRPFTQADNSLARAHRGTGLGLTISRRLARMLGGDISVKSSVGEGSCFTVTVAAEACDDAARTPNTTSEPLGSGEAPRLSGHFLVVDDHADLRDLVRRCLEDAGGRVTTADNGREALDVVERLDAAGDGVDAIVLDMQMPMLDGYETARRLRSRGVVRPILALTADAMRSDRDRCLTSGCDAHLAKPLERGALVRGLAGLLPSVSGGAERSDETEPPAVERRDVSSSAQRILLVEDDLDARMAQSLLLRSRGHQVVEAATGREALQRARETSPDIVLLDLGLPDLSGFEVFRRLKADAALTDAFFIAYTGVEGDHVAVKDAGFDHHLMKPATREQMDHAFERAAHRLASACSPR